jgi:hypothetical protein
MDSIKIITGSLHFEFTMAWDKTVMINSDIFISDLNVTIVHLTLIHKTI